MNKEYQYADDESYLKLYEWLRNAYNSQFKSDITLVEIKHQIRDLECLHISFDAHKKNIPESIYLLVNLKELDLCCFQPTIMNNLGNFPLLEILKIYTDSDWQYPFSTDILNHKKLKCLELYGDGIEITENLGVLEKLERLIIMNNQISHIPKNIGLLPNLNHLLIKNSFITSLPETIGKLENLKILTIKAENLTELPINFANLPNLYNLLIYSEAITVFPQETSGLKNVQNLDVSLPSVTQGVEVINNLVSLKNLSLNISYQGLKNVSFHQLKQLDTLHLKLNNSEQITRDELWVYLDPISSIQGLKDLDFEIYGIGELPQWMEDFQDLENFSSHSISFMEFPPFIKKLKKLTYISLRNSRISEIPTWINELQQLKTLNLQENYIYELPDMSQMKNLRVVQLDNSLRVGFEYEFEEIIKNMKKSLPPNCILRFVG